MEYSGFKKDFEEYKMVTEKELQKLKFKNFALTKELDELVNIVEISKYINANLASENLMNMINDIIIGVLGVTYSTIYLYEKNKLVIKSSNADSSDIIFPANILKCITLKESFLINSENIFPPNSIRKNIRSMVGVPIKIRNNFIGYIIVEHTMINFFEQRHVKFIESICNQVGIAIENSLLYLKMEENSKRDSLLNIYNRKYFFEVIEKKLIKSKNGKKYAIVMVDIDNFKSINDKYGHLFGDNALINSIDFIKRFTKKSDIIARYGGEEIIIYMEFEKPEEIIASVMAMKKCFEDNTIIYDDKSCGVTASFGIAFYPKDGHSIETVLKLADKFLYKAKEEGKNKIVNSYTDLV